MIIEIFIIFHVSNEYDSSVNSKLLFHIISKLFIVYLPCRMYFCEISEDIFRVCNQLTHIFLITYSFSRIWSSRNGGIVFI